ncbi:MAG: ClpXP protease specificity-enhancing factor [Proteobacteria bacterium]|jgi:stringent starvation protein B|nr:ClpXP protease specificity-enhancing factor [Pseudomonadota bacterium]MBK7115156.1 ClpXP protease specificity-enhancing factor [Pseudomonadota bacterium]MBK9252261.1 ClpXP protease specificity-enhancing factor [Pseudomonadota bacterium]
MLDWMVDCGYTPHLIVDASSDVVQVPRQFVKEGKIVLNISASATQSFQIGADAVEFNARFGGVGHHIRVPVDFVLGIYARETGQGMVFTEEGSPVPGTPGNSNDGGGPDPSPPPPEKPRRPSLKVVK